MVPPELEALCPRPVYSLEEELEEEEKSLLHPPTAVRADVYCDETSTDGEESEEVLEMTEGEDDVELNVIQASTVLWLAM